MTTRYLHPQTENRNVRRAVAARWIERGIALLSGEEIRSTPQLQDGDAISTFCADCGEDFTITSGQRQWLAARGLALFKRCSACRASRRQQQRQDGAAR